MPVLTAHAASAPSPANFHKHVLPILQNRCRECHRAGEAALMEGKGGDQSWQERANSTDD